MLRPQAYEYWRNMNIELGKENSHSLNPGGRYISSLTGSWQAKRCRQGGKHSRWNLGAYSASQHHPLADGLAHLLWIAGHGLWMRWQICRLTTCLMDSRDDFHRRNVQPYYTRDNAINHAFTLKILKNYAPFTSFHRIVQLGEMSVFHLAVLVRLTRA